MNNFDFILFHDSPRRLNPFTPSTWDHIGIVLKDPIWIHPSLKGTFIWEKCGDELNMSPLKERIAKFPGRVYQRKASFAKKLDEELLKDTCERLRNNPQNVLNSFLEIKNPEDKVKSSSLISYLLVRMHFLNFHGIRGKFMSPDDFAPKHNIDKFLLPGLSYSEKLIKLR